MTGLVGVVDVARKRRRDTIARVEANQEGKVGGAWFVISGVRLTGVMQSQQF